MDKITLIAELLAALNVTRNAEATLPNDPCYRAAYDLGYTAAARKLRELLDGQPDNFGGVAGR
ncbi:MAG: hypothetical protein PHX83_07120 [Acidobacteriia bacterium]|nr:hypothetical protein [Terriglobia bacterium]